MKHPDLRKKLAQVEGLTDEERAYLQGLLSTTKKYGLVWEDKPEDAEERLKTELPVLEEVVERRVLSPVQERTAAAKESNQLTLDLTAPAPNVAVADDDTTSPLSTGASVPERSRRASDGGEGGLGGEADKAAPNHLLIEGDNLHALTALSFTHAGKVDVIYIDPPYNTGNNDFRYNDTFRDDYISKEHPFRHSTWLSFMARRLKIAKTLLKETGVIFMSIDDNEQAQLKLLCDEIFDNSNFINQISVKSKPTAGASGGGEDKKLKKNIEFVICYSKNKQILNIFNNVYESVDLLEFIEDYRSSGKSWKYTRALISLGEKEYIKDILDGSGEVIRIYKHSNVIVKTISELAEKEKLNEIDVYFKYFEKIFRDTNAQSSIRQRVIDATSGDDNFYSIEYFPRSGKNKNKKTILIYKGINKDLIAWLSDVSIKEKNRIVKKDKLGTLWSNFNWNNVSKEGNIAFPNGKKPVALIKTILELCTKGDEGSIILDFFAGSGTTLHATMALNAEDGGNRQCILVTNNENNIAEEVCYERNKRVIEGYTKPNGEFVPGLSGNNLRYFRVGFVGSERTLANEEALARAATDLIAIKEDAYEHVDDNEFYTVLKNNNRYVVIVYPAYYQFQANEAAIAAVQALPLLDTVSRDLSLYAYTPTHEIIREDFEPIWERIDRAIPLPMALKNTYKQIRQILGLNQIAFSGEKTQDTIS